MNRLAIIMLMVLSVCSCRTIRENVVVEKPVVVHDTIMQSSLRTDSLYVRDSVYVDGNTIYKERVYWRSRTNTDTMYIVRTDTITIVKSKTIEVEKRLGLFDSMMIKAGKILSIAMIIFILCFIVYRVRMR